METSLPAQLSSICIFADEENLNGIDIYWFCD
jgi:hypothetical protein